MLEIPVVEIPTPDELIRRIRGLPAARPLLERLGERPGLYLVGGAVRDLLLGGDPGDLDFVLEGDAVELASDLGVPSRSHDRFGTASFVIDGFAYDVASSRRERYERPGALPEVEAAPLHEDLERRDFTVNAIAVALAGAGTGELTCVPGALEDLEARLLRVLHDRSFLDDPTRLIRLVRYRSRLGFDVEGATSEQARAAVQSGALGKVSGPRVGAELRSLAGEPDPVAALVGLREYAIDAAIARGFGIEDREELARRAIELLPRDGGPGRVALAVALMGVAPAERAPLLDRLGWGAGDRDAALAVASRSPGTAEALQSATGASQIADAVGEGGVELVALAGALGPIDPARQWLERLRHVALEISGDDLVAAGVESGPAVGEGLRAALAAKLDGRISGREQELDEALRAAR